MSAPSQGPQLKQHIFKLRPGDAATDFRTFGNFVFIDTAATVFELSFDNINFIPMREGRMIQVNEEFDTFYLRCAGTTPVEGICITGRGSISNFASFGGGGIGGNAPAALMPFDSYAALGNAPTVANATGVYAIVITGNPPATETWQLRAWTSGTAPVTNADEGIVVPADYSAANKRVWFRA